MPETTISAPVVTDAIDRLVLGAFVVREVASSSNLCQWGCGTCMAEE